MGCSIANNRFCMLPRQFSTCTVSIVRHADKSSVGSSPYLAPAGLIRSIALSRYMEQVCPSKKHLVAVYACRETSSYRSFRPQQTAAPTAQMFEVTIQTAFTRGQEVFTMEDILQQCRQWMANAPDGSHGHLLVVWEHSAIARLVQAAGGSLSHRQVDFTWPDDDFDSVVNLRYIGSDTRGPVSMQWNRDAYPLPEAFIPAHNHGKEITWTELMTRLDWTPPNDASPVDSAIKRIMDGGVDSSPDESESSGDGVYQTIPPIAELDPLDGMDLTAPPSGEIRPIYKPASRKRTRDESGGVETKGTRVVFRLPSVLPF